MSPRDLVRALAASRIAVGVALLLAPRRIGRLFWGPDADTPAASVAGRAAGARDALIGGMVLHTADNPQVARRWIASVAAIDAVDGLAAFAARDGLPRTRGWAFVVLALGSAVQHALLSQKMVSAEGLEATAARSTPAPASSPETVMPDGAEEAKRAMGARTIGVDTPK